MEGNKQLSSNLPIAVFDSGLGGISVLKEMTKIMPNENFWYYGDSLNAPYGTKREEEIRNLTLKKVEYFVSTGVKALAVACNTATSAAVRELRSIYPDLPIVGIEPAIKPAVMAREDSTIVVMATPMTLKMEKFQRLMSEYEDMAKIIPLPCPGLMELVEKGCLYGEEMDRFLDELFAGLDESAVDAVVLGCTHYPFVRRAIQKHFGERVHLFDGGEGTARELKRRIGLCGLFKTDGKPGEIRFENSLGQEQVELSKKLYQADI